MKAIFTQTVDALCHEQGGLLRAFRVFASYMRMNSHLQKRHNQFEYQNDLLLTAVFRIRH